MNRSFVPLLLALLAFARLDAGTVVQFRTVHGDLDVELYDAEKPITSTNFLKYVTDGAYQDMFFHRRSVGNFVIQGGGFRVVNRATTNENIAGVPTRPTILNEFAVAPFLPNLAGTIAMAKTSDPNSASSQFFFNFQDNPAWDNPLNSGGFTVFGRVIRGTNTLEAWNRFTVYNPITNPTTTTDLIVNAGAPFGELPLLKLAIRGDGTRYVDLADLVYVDVTLLRVQVTHRADGTAEVKWNPVAGRTNFVEYTVGFPPSWQPLTNLPPEAIASPVYTGAPLPNNDAPKVLPTVIVDPTGDPNRFYRVRATY